MTLTIVPGVPYTDLPVVDGYTDGVHVIVWCSHERDWHYHGRCTGRCAPRRRLAEQGKVAIQGTPCECPPGSGDGHRVSHCRCKRSYRGGYVVREVGPWTTAVKRAHRVSRRQECPGAECVGARRQAAEDLWRRPYGADVLEIGCPKCHAEPGEMCWIRRGKVHTARLDARTRAHFEEKRRGQS